MAKLNQFCYSSLNNFVLLSEKESVPALFKWQHGKCFPDHRGENSGKPRGCCGCLKYLTDFVKGAFDYLAGGSIHFANANWNVIFLSLLFLPGKLRAKHQKRVSSRCWGFRLRRHNDDFILVSVRFVLTFFTFVFYHIICLWILSPLVILQKLKSKAAGVRKHFAGYNYESFALFASAVAQWLQMETFGVFFSHLLNQ